jgi:hypothetical protein
VDILQGGHSPFIDTLLRERVRVRVAQKLPHILSFSSKVRRNCLGT